MGNGGEAGGLTELVEVQCHFVSDPFLYGERGEVESTGRQGGSGRRLLDKTLSPGGRSVGGRAQYLGDGEHGAAPPRP